MKRIMLTVAYDGTDYHGWQYQPGVATIEGELNRHLSQLLQEEIIVTGASRTDTGVHGLCNLAVFDTGTPIPPEKISYALNRRLPEDICIRGSREVEPDFHPRKRPCRKTYEYRIWNDAFENPLCRRYSHFICYPLDVKKMNEASHYLIGEHNFTSFCAAGSTVQTRVRTIHGLQVEREGKMIIIRVTGNGFLYNMVRIIAGTLLEVGRGHREPEWVDEVLKAMDRTAAGPTAPAKGLVLKEYEFISAI